eukprot:2249054-Pyramimonas_sp.AAC.1
MCIRDSVRSGRAAPGQGGAGARVRAWAPARRHALRPGGGAPGTRRAEGRRGGVLRGGGGRAGGGGGAGRVQPGELEAGGGGVRGGGGDVRPGDCVQPGELARAAQQGVRAAAAGPARPGGELFQKGAERERRAR